MSESNFDRRNTLGLILGSCVFPAHSKEQGLNLTNTSPSVFSTAQYGNETSAIKAGERETPIGRLFFVSDASSSVSYFERTKHGSTEVARNASLASLSSPEPNHGVSLVNGAVQYKTSIADLAKAPTAIPVALLSEPNRSGNFRWVQDDMSAAVKSDPLQGVYVARDSDPSGAGGAWVRDINGAVPASAFGVGPKMAADDNRTALQAAVDFMLIRGGTLELPHGEIHISDAITIGPIPDAKYADRLFNMQGQGPGVNGTWLHFTAGSLIVEANHQLERFHITSDDGDGIIIKPSYDPPISYPTRSGLRDVRAEHCTGSGITIEDSWQYLMENVYARYNRKWGIEGKSGDRHKLSSNAWTIIGGELQGNGTKVGTKTGPKGNNERGSGGGLRTGRAIQLSILGTSIEGNIGDGLLLDEGISGLSIINVYFEKNGSHPSNRDICNDAPSNASLGPSNVFILNSNFTPRDYSEEVQERAIELYDVAALTIKNPIFFSTLGGASTTGYSKPPIRITETRPNRSTGWIEGHHFGWSGYERLLTNETHRFGRPTKLRFSPDLAMPGGGHTTSSRFYAPVPYHGGQRVDIAHFTRPVVASPENPNGRFVTSVYRGPSGTLFSQDSRVISYNEGLSVVRTQLSTSHAMLLSSNSHQGSAEVIIERTGDDKEDTLSEDVILLGVEITTYEGIVGSLD